MSVEKDDPRLNGTEVFPPTQIHTVFGDTYLLLNFLEKAGLISVLKTVFQKKMIMNVCSAIFFMEYCVMVQRFHVITSL